MGRKLGVLVRRYSTQKRKIFNYPNLELTEEQLKNYCLVEIQELLNRHGRSLSDFQDLPLPDPRLLTNLDNRLIREALDYDMNKSRIEHQQLHSLLNPEQRLIYEEVIESVHNKKREFLLCIRPRRNRKDIFIQNYHLKVKIRTYDSTCCCIFRYKFIINLSNQLSGYL